MPAIRFMGSRLLLTAACVLPGTALADDCADRAAAALAELVVLFQSPGDAPAGARELLLELCRTAHETGQQDAVAAAADEEAGEPPRLFGIEFRRAPEDARGRDRVRGRP